jgi:hypothetical protein
MLRADIGHPGPLTSYVWCVSTDGRRSIMPTPDDVRGSIAAMLNQIPDTMVASHGVLWTMANMGSVRGEDGEICLEEVAQLVNKLAATLVVTVIELDNRIERLAGRPGISDDMMLAIQSEFGMGT